MLWLRILLFIGEISIFNFSIINFFVENGILFYFNIWMELYFKDIFFL